jgi:hypothetical protein
MCVEPRSYTADFGKCIADVATTPLQERWLNIALDLLMDFAWLCVCAVVHIDR